MMAGVAGERHLPRPAGELAVGAERDMAVGMDRGDRQRPGRHRDPGLRQSQPAIKVSASGTGTAKRPAARNTANPSAIAAPAPPSSSGTQASGQPRFFERIPQRLRPHARSRHR